MSCSVDPIAWGEKNRVELATGKTQEWVLARTTRDNPALDDVVRTARAVMVKWFEGVALDAVYADAGDVVDDVQVLAISRDMPLPRESDQRREELDPLPLLAGGATAPVYLRIRFNYRGFQQSIPWPVWTSSVSPLRSSKLCPFGADWMLVWARAPEALTVAPEEAGLLDKLSSNAPGPIAALATLTELAAWGLGIYVVVQATTLARTFRRVA